MPDVVFNMASLEGNPFTYSEVQTLLDGITIGGHRLSDEQQVLHNIKKVGISYLKRPRKII